LFLILEIRDDEKGIDAYQRQLQKLATKKNELLASIKANEEFVQQFDQEVKIQLNK
jgi:hypothetical protein